MKISKDDYFFYEWLIIGKKITTKEFEQMEPSELAALRAEYDKFKNNLTM